MTASSTWPRHGRVTLKPFTEPLSETEWRRFYDCFRDPEIAEWNGSRPLRMPLWLFKRVVMGEVARGDRLGFGILDERGEWLGTVELYELTPSEATLGILIGAKDRWGQGYGTDAVKAVLEYAFCKLGLKKVKLRTYKHNLRAQRAFEKAGFRHVEKPPQGGLRLGLSLGPKHEFIPMEITKEEWGC
ncbi:MAG: GNAT family N-acetyltransferase [Meiothermus sp.]|uniref:GNAT family N-acetyltransferase n=1 Tax=Meiothermus sp. TaxID=1955249 RepID=UPI0025E29389|nr:GNAT family N-acetyltransferase [Meiothermus sp.]MCS7057388.1 GNAT family N-acetyltransferase [Meiothermus sp.]MCS7193607.1 GNAT family N-acetyltransferase [Meiothermus sp.]MCX7741102.1 GNAT family N-acetyltransferase [Meiothermus sp.]MDW8090621.1 GNAT family N-acetyltransferase [Meiothermus sp.]MDW8480537.1 GNAT family N-acetyltransferase [Meiothermus sp.]